MGSTGISSAQNFARELARFSLPFTCMDPEKVAENLKQFLDIGFARAPEDIEGYPVVFRNKLAGDRIIGQEWYVVKENVSPGALGLTNDS
jgi:hypothetical protein